MPPVTAESQSDQQVPAFIAGRASRIFTDNAAPVKASSVSFEVLPVRIGHGKGFKKGEFRHKMLRENNRV